MTTVESQADLLKMLDDEPSAGILAVADLRERRARAATQGTWDVMDPTDTDLPHLVAFRVDADTGFDDDYVSLAEPGDIVHVNDVEHIAAEANPVHARAEVAQWRGVVKRHFCGDSGTLIYCEWCRSEDWPCADLLDVVAAAKAYAGSSE